MADAAALAAAALVAASLAVIAAKPTRLGLELKGGVELVYQGKPTAQAKVDTESLNRAINIMRARGPGCGNNATSDSPTAPRHCASFACIWCTCCKLSRRTRLNSTPESPPGVCTAKPTGGMSSGTRCLSPRF